MIVSLVVNILIFRKMVVCSDFVVEGIVFLKMTCKRKGTLAKRDIMKCDWH